MVAQMNDSGYIKQPSDFRAEKSIAGLYDLGDTIGEGNYSVVKEARHAFTGELVAVKIINKEKVPSAERNDLLQEVRCMQLLQHPYIVRLLEVYDTPTKLYLIMEYGDGGDLHDFIVRQSSQKGLSEAVSKRYFAQIVQAVAYCHQKHIIHRDLKPENVVLFKKQNVVKLIDFGFGRKFDPEKPVNSACGSLSFSAPEMFLREQYNPILADVWSLGVILYWLVCGRSPFAGASDSETLTRILDGKFKAPSRISPDCRNLIERMLCKHPKQRMSLKEILSHRWLLDELDAQSVDSFSIDEPITASDHARIISTMVDGHVASKTEILASLEHHQFNHITATYFLLAERKGFKTVNAASSRHTATEQDAKQQYLYGLKPDQQQSSSAPGMALSNSESNLCIGKSMHHVFSSIREESFGISSRSSREIKCVSRSQSFPDTTTDNYELLLASQSVNSVAPAGTLRSSSPRLKSSFHDPRSRQMARSSLRQLHEKDAAARREGGDDAAAAAADGAAAAAKKRFPVAIIGGEDDEDDDELCARTGICKLRKGGFNVQRKLSTKAERFATTPFEAEESQLNAGDDVLVDDDDGAKKAGGGTPTHSGSILIQNSGNTAEVTSKASETLAPTEKESVETNSESAKRFQTKISPSSASETDTKPKKGCPCCIVQ